MDSVPHNPVCWQTSLRTARDLNRWTRTEDYISIWSHAMKLHDWVIRGRGIRSNLVGWYIITWQYLQSQWFMKVYLVENKLYVDIHNRWPMAKCLWPIMWLSTGHLQLTRIKLKLFLVENKLHVEIHNRWSMDIYPWPIMWLPTGHLQLTKIKL